MATVARIRTPSFSITHMQTYRTMISFLLGVYIPTRMAKNLGRGPDTAYLAEPGFEPTTLPVDSPKLYPLGHIVPISNKLLGDIVNVSVPVGLKPKTRGSTLAYRAQWATLGSLHNRIACTVGRDTS